MGRSGSPSPAASACPPRRASGAGGPRRRRCRPGRWRRSGPTAASRRPRPGTGRRRPPRPWRPARRRTRAWRSAPPSRSTSSPRCSAIRSRAALSKLTELAPSWSSSQDWRALPGRPGVHDLAAGRRHGRRSASSAPPACRPVGARRPLPDQDQVGRRQRIGEVGHQRAELVGREAGEVADRPPPAGRSGRARSGRRRRRRPARSPRPRRGRGRGWGRGRRAARGQVPDGVAPDGVVVPLDQPARAAHVRAQDGSHHVGHAPGPAHVPRGHDHGRPG